MFYHTLAMPLSFVCMFKKKKRYTPHFFVSVNGPIDMLSPRPSLFLSPPHRSLFSRSYIFTKVPFSLLSFHQRLSKGALILKAGLA